MFVLKKLFQLRENGRDPEDSEKPFLAHLEDLRDVIVKIVITLLIATIACYIFRGALLDVLRSPMEKVWTDIQIEKLPENISPELWEQAKKTAEAASNLSPNQKSHLFAQYENEELRYYAQTAIYYRTTLLIEDLDKRKEYIKNFPDIDQKTKDLLMILAEKEPSAALDAKGSAVSMQSLKPTETFMLAIKLSLFAGVIVSFPFLLYFILQFVLPGLKKNERKALWPALIVGFGLFLLGVVFCYFIVLPKALDFFFNYSKDMGVENEWRIGDYITFTTQFTLIFGLAFELPVIVMTLVKIGLLSYQTMSNTRSYAVLSIFVVGAIITPTGDALTLCLLAVPMCVLYEICIWLAYFHNKKEQAAEALEEAELGEYLKNQGESKEETPVPVPVPGRIATHSDGDHDDDHHDYDDHHHDGYHDHHAGEEGDEFDNGEMPEFTKNTDSKEVVEADEKLEHSDVQDDEDYNQGPSFEAPPKANDDKENDPPHNSIT